MSQDRQNAGYHGSPCRLNWEASDRVAQASEVVSNPTSLLGPVANVVFEREFPVEQDS